MDDEITRDTPDTPDKALPESSTEAQPDSPAERPAERLSELLTERLADPHSAPSDCTDEELSAVDFARRDVLIGTVRSDAQFDHTMASLSYYAPVKTVPPCDLPVRLIALYEDGLTRRPGIKRYGEVTEIRVVRRDEIPVPMSRPNGEEAYYLFSVKSWEYLEQPIGIAGTFRGRPAFTSEFLLTHARRSYQLVSIASASEYRLARTLCRMYDRASSPEGGESMVRAGDNHILSICEGVLSLIHARGEVLYRCPLSVMETQPAEVLEHLSVALGFRNVR